MFISELVENLFRVLIVCRIVRKFERSFEVVDFILLKIFLK